MQIENESINMQTFYNLCRNVIYQHNEVYSRSIEEIIIVPSWINTIDSLDISLISCDTLAIINRAEESNDVALYISLLTEITIILNNIFYSSTKPYRQFWKENALFLYTKLIYPLTQFEADFEQCQSPSMELDIYYHQFFVSFQDKCLRSGLTIALEEFLI